MSKTLSPSEAELSEPELQRLAKALADPDWRFILKRLGDRRVELAEHPERIEDAHRAAIIALLRSDIPLSRVTRDMLSNTLVTLWWPRKKQRKRSSEQAWLLHERCLRDLLAEHHRKLGANDPETQAEPDAAEALGLTLSALRGRRRRYQSGAQK
jgi:hypothetical protein